MPCGHFKHFFISTVATESSPSFLPHPPIPQLSVIVMDIKSQHQFLPPSRKRKLESDAISKFANWSRFPFVSTAPLWTLLLYLKCLLGPQLPRRLPQLRNSASSFQWLSSSIFSCSVVRSSHIGNISSHLHNMMFPSIQSIYFL